jgi:hypothetical protein
LFRDQAQDLTELARDASSLLLKVEKAIAEMEAE